jgi:hypothetical protein
MDDRTVYVLKDIKKIKNTGWTKKKIADAVDAIKHCNPTVQLIEVINGSPPEIVIRGTFAGKSTVFQTTIPFIADCVIKDLPFDELRVQISERFAQLNFERVKFIAAQKENDKKVAEEKRRLLIEEDIKTVNKIIDRFIWTAKSGIDEYCLEYHVKRCRNLPQKTDKLINDVVSVEYPFFAAMAARTSGPFLEIGREYFFIPKALGLIFKCGAGWRCRNIAQAEAILSTWEARRAEVVVALCGQHCTANEEI